MASIFGPANRSLLLIPGLKSNCDTPKRVGALNHIDFADQADQALAWCQMLTALGEPPEQAAAKKPERNDWFLAHAHPIPPNFTYRAAYDEASVILKPLDQE